MSAHPPTSSETRFERELDGLEADLRERLGRAGFDRRRWADLAATLREGDAATRRATRNRLAVPVRAPTPSDFLEIPEDVHRIRDFTELGEEALRKGELAFCVMAGGMATRMGGAVKALVEVFDGRRFLDLRLAENEAASGKAGRPVPLWLMTSDATDEPIRRALEEAKAPAHVATFEQDLGLRLTCQGDLFRDRAGRPSPYATGHGDLVDALRRSGLLDRFVASGGRFVWVANLDNLGASLDPLVLGLFVACGRPLLVEVCDKEPGDRGGIPVWAGDRLQVLEEFRLPEGFDPTTVRVFNTNTLLIAADALRTTPFQWTYFEVEKKVDGQAVVQFERLIQEVTATLPAAYLRVPRTGPTSRFLPVKDREELERRRASIRAAMLARGLPT